MYVTPNFPSKAAIRRAIKAGETVTVFQPNNIFGVVVPENGTATVEGPHFPKPHRWYGQVTIEDGKVTSIK